MVWVSRCDNGVVTDAERDEMFNRMDRALERSSVAIELNERSYRRLVESTERQQVAFREMRNTLDGLDATVVDLRRTVHDLADQIRANTDALLRLIDRLGPAPGATA